MIVVWRGFCLLSKGVKLDATHLRVNVGDQVYGLGIGSMNT